MKNILYRIGLFIFGVIMVLSPFGIFLLYGNNQPHIYSKTYYAALVDKVNYLESVKNEKKIILVGGSNVAFGFNSELLENEFPEYKVVNFGLYAMLGTKIMMDLALDYVNEGDLVFVIPEINSQSTSLYFNAESTLKALEDNMNIIKKLPKDNRDAVIGSYFDFVKERKKIKEVIVPKGVYQRNNFNQYGDVFYEEVDENGIGYRAANRMALYYDPTMMVDYSCKIDNDFFTYLNEYDKKIAKKKATLYYAFSPVNEKAVIDEEETTNYYWSIRQNVSCKVVGNPNQYMIDAHYFYDSNFHLNNAGATLRTYLFAQDIYRDVLQKNTKPNIVIPEMPPYIDESEVGPDSETAICFDYVEYEDSLLISNIKDEFINEENIILPAVANGKKVVGITRNAFSKSNAINDINIPISIKIIMDGAFGNCPSLTGIYIETYNPSDIIVSYTGSMTEDVTEEFIIYIHDGAFTDFATDYYWGAYSSYFRRY